MYILEKDLYETSQYIHIIYIAGIMDMGMLCPGTEE